MHLGIDAQTLEIRAIEEFAGNAIGDAPMRPELLAQIHMDEQLHSVSADGAYDIRACHEAITSGQAAAIIPTRKTPSLGQMANWGASKKRVPEGDT